ncbi:uncharacterized protein LOC142634682 [Castanea sativa]|uniref:uncharacterized protein LOC142634682 n=1 Tax=Castanea sativa TaxID=21020 RepID=UPI003F64A79A
MAAQGLVRYGIRWRIGNGEQVRVWGDKWLPSPSTYQVSSPKLFLSADTQVCEFINKEEATWKIDVLKLYKAETSATCSDDSVNRRFWKQIWQLSIPHKDSRSEGCNQEDETAGHLFWTCPRAREMWQNSKWVFPVQSEHCSSFKELMWCLLMVDQPRFELVAKVGTCAWALWYNRNEVRLGGVRKAGHVLLRGAVQYVEEYYAVYELSPTPLIPAAHRKTWSPLLDHSYKVNVDGATFSDLGAVGIGVIVRDVSGQVVAALSSKLMAPLGAIETEAKALEAGLQFDRDVGIQDFILESDSLLLICSLAGLSSPPSSMASVVQGLLEISGEFRKVAFSHVCRQGNRPAHLLAKHAKGIVDFSTWLEEKPCFLEQALLHDVLSFADS